MNSASTLVEDLAWARALARDLPRSGTLSGIERTLARAQALASELSRFPDFARDCDVLYSARFLADQLDLVRAFAVALESASHVDGRRIEHDLDRALPLGRLLSEVGVPAARFVRHLEAARVLERTDRVTGSVHPSEMSRRLAGWATRLLPVADRPEYAELFRSELYELALSGCSRHAQIGYALRVLVRAPLLRRELRAPARERSW